MEKTNEEKPMGHIAESHADQRRLETWKEHKRNKGRI
jgi:hypothetical protein